MSMTEETGAPAIGAEEWDSPSDSPETDPSPTPTQDAATGSETPGLEEDAERGPIPYERFAEVVHARQQLEAQLSQFQPLTPWQSAIEALSGRGVTPEQLLQQLQQPPPPTPEPPAPSADPQAAFEDYLATQGLTTYDLEGMEPWQQGMLQTAFRHEQAIAGYEAQAQAAQQQAARAQWQADLQQVTQAHPEFRQPLLQEALLNTYEGRHGASPNLAAFQALAGELKAALAVQTQAELAKYQTQKQQDGRVPVVAGGGTPPPVVRKDYHTMTDAEQRETIAEFWRSTAPTA